MTFVRGVLVVCALACSRPAPKVDAVPTAPPTSAITPTAIATPSASVSASASAAVPATSVASPASDWFELRNLEMEPYCFQVPSKPFHEDHVRRYEHGTRVFLGSAPRPSRLEFSVSCGERSLKELYEADRKDILAKVPASDFPLQVIKEDSYVVSWKVGIRIHYGKVWKGSRDAKGASGCFVRTIFEYDEAERATFDALIPKIVASGPVCRDK